MSFSFIQISDIHLGRPFSDLSKYSVDINLKHLYKNAVEKALNNAVDFAIAKAVDFVLICGDTFDSNEQDFEAKIILKEVLNKLLSADIKVFLICGNHDPLSSYNKLTFDFDENSPIHITGLNSKNPAEYMLKDISGKNTVIIHAFSFENNVLKENPVKYFTPPQKEDEGAFHIGMLHCDLDCSSESPYAPCKSSQLKDINYNYWALGHIHIPSVIDDKIVYSGTVQGRNTKETGAHGIRYIKVDDNNVIAENSFIPLDVIRYEDLCIDLSSSKDITSAASVITDSVYDLIGSDKNTSCELFLLRIYLTGMVCFYDEINEQFFSVLSERLNNQTQGKICISQINNNTSIKADLEAIISDEGIAGEIYKTIQNDDNMTSFFNSVQNSLQKLVSDCNYSEEEKQKLQVEVLNSVKENCINICGSICADERTVD